MGCESYRYELPLCCPLTVDTPFFTLYILFTSFFHRINSLYKPLYCGFTAATRGLSLSIHHTVSPGDVYSGNEGCSTDNP